MHLPIRLCRRITLGILVVLLTGADAERQLGRRQATATTTAAPTVTAVSECHMHQTVQFCMAGPTEYRILTTATTSLPASYTGCHSHASETWCLAPGGGEVEVVLADAAVTTESHTPVETGASAGAGLTAISECHLHESTVLCMAGATEYRVDTTITATSDLPPAYTSCHSHEEETFCVGPAGDDVEVHLSTEDGDSHGQEEAGEQRCHFHAGVEHCVGGSAEEQSAAVRCQRVDRDYNIPLRVGLLFVILVTSAIGVFGPIILAQYLPPKAKIVLLVVKQFGTGVIISTSLVHLFTHASLMFGNECLGELEYEAVTAAIMMAGLFLSFLVEYVGYRIVKWQAAKKRDIADASTSLRDARSAELVSIYVMEAGVIFHSLLIGLTLVVAGDSFLLTLFAVILFHQMFEGVALGSRIAALGSGSSRLTMHTHGHGHTHHGHAFEPSSQSSDVTESAEGMHRDESPPSSLPPPNGSKEGHSATDVSMRRKLGLAGAFALVTPLGMAIGIGALHRFNGNDPATIVAIGTLDALSAGILLWVGVVEMWAADWVFGGEMTDASLATTLLGMIGLVAGMAVMSLLGKWA